MAAVQALLGDTVQRDYARKLRLFHDCARRELRQVLRSLRLKAGMQVLDAGCGSGEMLALLAAAVGSPGTAVGLDLAAAHTLAAHGKGRVLQADLLRAPLRADSFDLIWSANTINHLREPLTGVQTLCGLLRTGGRLALAQSALLPEMYFAWDARLERVTNEAVRRYYRERYGLAERELSAVRALLGVLRAAGLCEVRVRTWLIERTAPLAAADEAYLLEAVFRGTWGERLRPYLSAEDYAELERLCDPEHPAFALRRPDFHFLQTFTLAVGRRPAGSCR
jgi:SAM-dependent methyltransferase